MFVNKQEFLAKASAKREIVNVGEDGQFYVRGMTAKEIQGYAGFEGKSEQEKAEAALKQFACCVLNEDGSQMFDPESKEDLDLISGIAFSVVNDVANRITVLSGLGKKVDDAAKN